ncbi:redoxin domain-containing protein [Rossellomorea vietnamensis]|uniref:Redoxin domain-containing protein n=2 Tax=Bacillales TaxID=1385 RepID=A0A5D4MEJ7_9BACI|nr:redoxin domain-containing protein [Rossellomorea vietnamensis]
MDYRGNQEGDQFFCAQTSNPAPLFSAEAFFNADKSIKNISLNQLRGKWVILFFYGSDFTFV